MQSILVAANSLTALETWIIACIFFNFLALLEYGLVQLLAPTTTNSVDEKAQGAGKDSVKDTNNAWQQTERAAKRGMKCLDTKAIDKVALVLLMSLFAVFNVVFWVVYL